MSEFEWRVSRPQALVVGLLLLALCAVLIFRFTSRSEADAERDRARVMLRTIDALERAYFEEYGTYLPIDREKNDEILKLSDAPGRFRYRVTVSGAAFVATAEADLDGDGEVEVWQIDQEDSDPVLVRGD